MNITNPYKSFEDFISTSTSEGATELRALTKAMAKAVELKLEVEVLEGEYILAGEKLPIYIEWFNTELTSEERKSIIKKEINYDSGN